jgi:hypothetical protein
MMKMDFDLTVSVGLQGSESIKERRFVLLCGKEICMAKWSAIVIADSISRCSRQLAPVLYASQCRFTQTRFVMVRNQYDDVRLPLLVSQATNQFEGFPSRIID